MHVAYLDDGGAIQDAWYDGGTNKWDLQQLSTITAVSACVPTGGFTRGTPVQGFTGSPIVVDDTVFIGCNGGYFFALNAATGALKWRFPNESDPPLVAPNEKLRYGIQTAASYWEEKGWILFSAQDPSLGPFGSSRLFAIDAQTGAHMRKSDPIALITGVTNCATPERELHQRTAWSAPLIFNNKAYFGIHNFGDTPIQLGRIVAVDLDTFKLDPAFQFRAAGSTESPPQTRGGGIWNAPATDGDGIFFTTGNTKTEQCGGAAPQPEPSPNLGLSMIRIDKDTGAVTWQLQPVPFDLARC
jgi:glucose dehydrogenase